MEPLNITDIINHRRGGSRLKKVNLTIDMTPMVDLGFLLISFFVITTTLSEPKAMDLFVPKAGPFMPVANSKTLTVLLDKDNRILYYHGNWETAVKTNSIYSTTYSVNDGFGNIIRTKQKFLENLSVDKEGRKGLLLIIKAEEGASYKNLIDVLDEVLINGITHYVIVEPTDEELKYTAAIY